MTYIYLVLSAVTTLILHIGTTSTWFVLSPDLVYPTVGVFVFCACATIFYAVTSYYEHES